MPIYEFKCSACGAAFEELFRSASEKRRPTCPTCGAKKTRRLPSVFAMSAGGGEPSSRGSSKCGPCTRTSCAGCR